MSSSFSSNSPKKAQVTVSTTELPDEDHPFPNDATKSIISRELSVFQELLSSKPLQTEILDIGDNQSLIEEREVRQEENRKSLSRAPTVKQTLTQDINPTSSMFNAEPFTPSVKGPCFANTSQSFWYSTASPLLSKLLSTAHYPLHLQDQYMFFYNHSVLPALGPPLSPTNKWIPHLTHNSSPFEPSLAFQNNKQQVRFTFEPIGPLAGTPDDRFNQTLPLSFVSALESTNICPNLNLEWWNHFTNAFFVSGSEIAMHPSLFTGVKVQPTCFLAFDLPSDKFAPVFKSYLFPHRRALLEKMSKADIVFEAIRNLPYSPLDHSPALEIVEKFLSQHQDSSVAHLEIQEGQDATRHELKAEGMSVEMLSFDCVSPSEFRLKIYAKTLDTSFSNVQKILILGKSLNSSNVTLSLKALEEFWKSLLLLGDDWDDNESQSAEFLYFGFEISPGRTEPGIKVYIPSWTLGLDKMGLTRGLGRYFRDLGWDVGNSYRNDIQDVFGGIDEQERGGYTYVSFTYGGKGPAVTLYCAPKFPLPS